MLILFLYKWWIRNIILKIKSNYILKNKWLKKGYLVSGLSLFKVFLIRVCG